VRGVRGSLQIRCNHKGIALGIVSFVRLAVADIVKTGEWVMIEVLKV